MTGLQILLLSAGTILFGVTFAWWQLNQWRSARTNPYILFAIAAAGALLEILAVRHLTRELFLTISSAIMLASMGAAIGGGIVDEVMRRRPGMTHAVISNQRQTGLIWVGVVACACGLPATAINLSQPQKPGWELYAPAQAAFWIFFALRTYFTARTKWSLVEPGVLTPTGLIPWRNVLSYEWAADDMLYLKVRHLFGSSTKMTIRTIPGVRDSAKAILESRVLTVWVNRQTTTPTAPTPRSDTMALL